MTTRLRYIENSTVIGDSAVAVLLQKKTKQIKYCPSVFIGILVLIKGFTKIPKKQLYLTKNTFPLLLRRYMKH